MTDTPKQTNLAEIAFTRIVEKLAGEIFIWNCAAQQFQAERDKLLADLQKTVKLLEDAGTHIRDLDNQNDKLISIAEEAVELAKNKVDPLGIENRVLSAISRLKDKKDLVDPDVSSDSSIEPIPSILPKEE
jgi:hypothetical protein